MSFPPAYTKLWDNAFEEAHWGRCPEEVSDFGRAESVYAMGAEWGAGWAFAIIGMAQAIRDGVDAGRFSREHWEYIGDEGWERWPDGARSKTPPEGY